VNRRQSAFEYLINPHLKPLYRVAYRLTGRREDAEDLIQELLVKLYIRREEMQGIEQLRPWLLRVLYCQFIDTHRKNSRSPLRLTDSFSEGASDPLDSLVSPDGGPEADVEQANQNRSLLRAIASLSEDHRVVISLHDMEGYTLEEIQTMLDCPIGTLKSRLHRARARLRELLQKDRKDHTEGRLDDDGIAVREAGGNS
jgi:RNA polymerase sigma factor (sigma-70 family)